MNTSTQGTPAIIKQPVSLLQLAMLYLKIGFTGFGPALATETKKHLVKGQKWLSEEDFVNGMALAQLLPGATFVSLTVYVGYKIRGIAGALTCFSLFCYRHFRLCYYYPISILPMARCQWSICCFKVWRWL